VTGNRLAAALALCAVVGLAPRAWADEASSNTTLAQTLFDDALKLMDQGRFSEACPKLAESQRLDPGGGTLLNLGFCREKEGKLASAWAAYDEALSQAIKDGRKDREATARVHVTDLEGKLAKLEVDVTPSARATTGIEVRLDGTPVRQAAWGVLTPIDRGPHAIVVTAPGKREWDTQITVQADGTVQHVSIPALADAPLAATPGAPHHGAAQSMAGWLTGGLGVVLLGVGITTGALAIDYRHKSDVECPNNQCTQKGVDLNEQAKTYAWVADFTVGFGVAAVGAGVVLLLTAPKTVKTGARVVPLVGRDGGGLGLAGFF
jgi:hypothetical protein